MLDFLNRRFSLVFIPFFLFLIFFSSGTTQVFAQTCGSARTQEIITCYEPSPGHCVSNPETQISHDYTCVSYEGTCQGVVLKQYCEYVNGICKLTNDGNVWIPCGGGQPGGNGAGGYGIAEGYTCNPRKINGWIIKTQDGNPVNGSLYVKAAQWPIVEPNMSWFPAYLTDVLRQDVNDYYGITGNHGYSLDFPVEWMDGQSRNVKVYGAGSLDLPGTELQNSPITITCTPPTCSIAGPSSVNVNTNATYYISSSANATRTEVWKSPTDHESWATPAICSSSGNCSGTTQFTSPGTYWVVGNAINDNTGLICTGNPFGLYGFSYCGDSCKIQVTVPTPTPTTAPTPTPTTIPTPTPTPFGTIKARAVRVSLADTSCAAIRAVLTTDGQGTGTTHQFSGGSESQPTSVPADQSGSNYVTFANIITGFYRLVVSPPANWVLQRYCLTNETTGTQTNDVSSATLLADQTLHWDVGYTLGTAWVQTVGGDMLRGTSGFL